MEKQEKNVLNIYKQIGETPLSRLERLRKERPEFANETLSYAGRLDPMAEGVMLVLAGAANQNREKYLNLSKEYTFDILFGFSTDTYDILGRVTEVSPEDQDITAEHIQKVLNEFRGSITQAYPPFSSKTVDGKALFALARAGELASVALPSHAVHVYELDLEKVFRIKEGELLAYIETNIAKVRGDFRQEETLHLWREQLDANGVREFLCARVRALCSSGTYMRGIANGVGKELGAPALALHILRTKVGDFDVKDSL